MITNILLFVSICEIVMVAFFELFTDGHCIYTPKQLDNLLTYY